MMLAVLDNFLYGFLVVALVLLATEHGGGLGSLNAALAVGATAAMAVVNRLVGHGSVEAMPLVMVLGFAGCAGALGVVGAGPAALLLVALGGATTLVAEVAAVTLLQRSVDDATRARVFGVYDQLNVGAIALGSLLAGPLAAVLGARGALVAAGLAVAAASTPGLRRAPARPRLSTVPRTPRPVP
jgi:hypothetical protein